MAKTVGRPLNIGHIRLIRGKARRGGIMIFHFRLR